MHSRVMDNQKAGRSRLFWTDFMDKSYSELLVEHTHNNGGTEGPLFRKSAWRDMTVRFNAKTRMNIETDQLKNRLRFYRHEFRIVKDLKKLPGFHWDDKKQVMVADDSSWNQYFEKKPAARYYRSRSVACFKDLEIIFGSSSGTCNASSSIQDVDIGEDIIEGVGRTEGSEESKPFTESKSTPDEPAPATNAINLVVTQSDEHLNARDHHKHWSSMASTTIQAEKGNQCDGVEPMVTIARAPEMDVRATGIVCRDNFRKMDECMAVLNTIRGLEDELYVKALFILRDEYNRYVFLNTTGRRRLAWLRAVTRDVGVS